MKTFLIDQIVRQEIQTINEYKKFRFNNNDICFILELKTLSENSILNEIDIRSIIKMIGDKIKQLMSLKNVNLNMVKVITRTIRGSSLPNIFKKMTISIISLILINSAISSVSYASENVDDVSESKQAYAYAAGCIAFDAELNPDIDNRHIVIKLQKLARAGGTEQSLDSLNKTDNTTFDTIKWIGQQLGDLQGEYKDIIKDTNAFAAKLTNEQNYNYFEYLSNIGLEAIKSAEKHQYKVTSSVTSSNPLENSYEQEQTPTDELPSYWSK